MIKPRSEITPIQPGTFIRMFPERHPDGKYWKDTTWNGKPVYFEGHPVFEVASFILDRCGTYVTFQRDDGTCYMRGSAEFHDKKFPFPHPMFEIVGEAEAAQLRERRDRALAVLRAEYAKRSWLWPFSIRLWPGWLRLRRCVHT